MLVNYELNVNLSRQAVYMKEQMKSFVPCLRMRMSTKKYNARVEATEEEQ